MLLLALLLVARHCRAQPDERDDAVGQAASGAGGGGGGGSAVLRWWAAAAAAAAAQQQQQGDGVADLLAAALAPGPSSGAERQQLLLLAAAGLLRGAWAQLQLQLPARGEGGGAALQQVCSAAAERVLASFDIALELQGLLEQAAAGAGGLLRRATGVRRLLAHAALVAQALQLHRAARGTSEPVRAAELPGWAATPPGLEAQLEAAALAVCEQLSQVRPATQHGPLACHPQVPARLPCPPRSAAPTPAAGRRPQEQRAGRLPGGKQAAAHEQAATAGGAAAAPAAAAATAAAAAHREALAALLAALLQLWRELPLAARLARAAELDNPWQRRAAAALFEPLCLELLALGPGQPHVAQQMLALLQQPLLWSACHGIEWKRSGGSDDGIGDSDGEAAAQQRARMRRLLLTVAPQLLRELLLQPPRSELPGTTGWGCASRGTSCRAACSLLQLLASGLGGALEPGEALELGLPQLVAELPLALPGEPGNTQLAELHAQLAAALAAALGRGRGRGRGRGLADDAARPLVEALLQNLQVSGGGVGGVGLQGKGALESNAAPGPAHLGLQAAAGCSSRGSCTAFPCPCPAP
jgi:hypothetical protein